MCLAIPGKILDIQDHDQFMRTGRVSFGGIVREVNLAFVPEAAVGHYVLVHAGVAINVIDEEEANRVFEYLEQIVDGDEAEGTTP